MKIVGIVQKSGTYQGRDYSNVQFHCTSPITKNGVGYLCSVVKCSNELVDLLLTGQKCKLNDLIGRDVEFYYDPYGRVSLINLK